jgi:small subunit ribosomal protein S13
LLIYQETNELHIPLTYIHGIGLTSAKKIIEIAGINPETRSNDLTTEETITLRQALEDLDLKLEGDLRRFNGLNIKRLNEINCHRGKRHRNNLPVRQRTRTNVVLNVDRRRLLLVRKNNLKIVS